MDSLYYQLNKVPPKTPLYDLVDAEVSRAADGAYADDGTGLYDQVVLTEKDRAMVDAVLTDGLAAFARSSWDIASYYEVGSYIGSTPVTSPTMRLDVPDFDASQYPAAEARIDRFIVLFACCGIFRERRPALVQDYDAKAEAARIEAVTLLRKRTRPTRT